MSPFSINLPKKLKYNLFIILPACLALSRTQILVLPNSVGYIVLLDHSFHGFDHYKELLYIYKKYISDIVHSIRHDCGSHMC